LNSPLELWQVVFHRSPDFLKIYSKIFMHQNITHCRHLRPRGFWMFLAKCIRELAGSFPGNLDMMDNPGLYQLLVCKGCPALSGITLHLLDGFQNI